MAEPTRPWDLVSDGTEQTLAYGRRLGGLLEPGDVVLMEGQFGAGKTVLSQGIAQGLGVVDYVTSPSFTLINEYRADQAHEGLRVYHIDLYRIEAAEEVLDLGLLDYLGGDGVCLVEWAERLRPLVPADYLLVTLEVTGDTTRRLRFEAFGVRHVRLLERFRNGLAG
ncbi:MAG: tRNA (adenosine(37)-N6)-threonylcarbamoyltransferase complex ATPase subunit type 1 TsaE [Chloroflexota bacterium]